ncbi:MAG: hypothetical protein ACRDRL_32565, partial [Sciscionella sp.]
MRAPSPGPRSTGSRPARRPDAGGRAAAEPAAPPEARRVRTWIWALALPWLVFLSYPAIGLVGAPPSMDRWLPPLLGLLVAIALYLRLVGTVAACGPPHDGI